MRISIAFLLACLIFAIPRAAVDLTDNLRARRLIHEAGNHLGDVFHPCAGIAPAGSAVLSGEASPAVGAGQDGYIEGLERWYAGDCPGALEVWRAEYASDGGKRYWAGARLGWAELELGRRDQAIVIFRDLAFGKQILVQADAAGRTGDAKEAVRLYRLAVEIDPQPGALLSTLEFMRANREDVLPVLDEVRGATTPEQATYWLALAELAAEQGAWPAASEKLEQALSLSSGSIGLYLRLGELYTNAGNYRSAVAAYEQAVQQEPRGSYVLYIRAAEAEQALGNDIEADGWYAQAMRMFPNDPWPFLHAGVAAFNQNELGRAEEFFQAALRLEPENPYGLLHYAALKHRQGDLDAAIAYVEQVYFSSSSCHAAALLRKWYPEAGRDVDYQEVNSWYDRECDF